MNRLSPELQRLIRLARQAPAAQERMISPGFASRVVAQWCAPPPLSLFGIWQRAVWGSAWAATAVIVMGLALITVQKLRSDSTYDLSPAYQVVATELVP